MPHSEKEFLEAVKVVKSYMLLSAITKCWNESGLGNTAKDVTVKRWLRLGPVTKNPRFEPWVINLAKELQTSSALAETTQLLRVLVHDIQGLSKFTAGYNVFRAKLGKPPVQEQTIKRYANGGSGYESGPPQLVLDYAKRIMYAIMSK